MPYRLKYFTRATLQNAAKTSNLAPCIPKRALIGGALLGVVIMSACAAPRQGDAPPKLMNIKERSGFPDEFAIQRNRALETDIDLKNLPKPKRGGRDIATPQPFKDVVAALGGAPNLSENSKMTNDEKNLLNYARRLGSDSNIRITLRLEDEQVRRENKARVLERVAKLNLYFKTYRDQILDPYEENDRLRRAGIKTTNPPPFTPEE